ncbi:MAG TPA: hypothetical protein VN524_16235 [Hyphomicrobiaceae bacterium]|nr:hypothetical protein [Hyphomicrobiaceae bacterium]
MGAVPSIAVAHPAFVRSERWSLLTVGQALELALLGITMAQPLGLERIVGLLQRIACPLLQPTADVIESRLQDLARRGLLSISAAGTGSAVARRTAAGLRHLRQLLCTPAPPRGAAHHDLVFMLKACLLDLLGDADRATVIDELRQDLHAALAAAEHAAGHCRSSSPFARHWLDRQVTRLRDDLLWLDSLADVESATSSDTPSPHPSPASR